MFQWFVNLHYIFFPILFAWSLTGIYAREHKSALFNAVYIALDRPFFCILLALTLMGLFHVDGKDTKCQIESTIDAVTV